VAHLPAGSAAVLALLLAGCAGAGPAGDPPGPVTPAEGSSPRPDSPPESRPDSAPAPPADADRPFVYGVDLDTVRAGRFDQGKMWTFEFPPREWFAEAYGLRLDDAWFEKARLGALRIPSCSASFVSPHGLVLTNHHCARTFVSQVSEEGEALLDDGMLATDLADERPVEGFEADRLVEIVDVSDEVNAALDSLPAEDRVAAREVLLEEIRGRVLEGYGGEESDHVVEMNSLYDGGGRGRVTAFAGIGDPQ